MHADRHPQAGEIVTVRIDGELEKLYIEDWWDKLTGGSWMYADGNPACLMYAIRTAGKVPIDDEVVYGKIGHLGYLVHVSEFM